MVLGVGVATALDAERPALDEPCQRQAPGMTFGGVSCADLLGGESGAVRVVAVVVGKFLADGAGRLAEQIRVEQVPLDDWTKSQDN